MLIAKCKQQETKTACDQLAGGLGFLQFATIQFCLHAEGMITWLLTTFNYIYFIVIER